MKPLMRAWRWARWPVGILVLAYIALVLYRIPAVGEKERTKDAVAYIHAQKITLSDVMGSNLPPPPNKQENDATVEGVDVNNNGVRDDVELAIFEKYPDSPSVRAAQLQYAMALQMELTKVFNSETWKVAVEQENRGYFCISNGVNSSLPKFDDLQKLSDWLKIEENANLFNTENQRVSKIIDAYTEEIKTLVLNTEKRKNHYEAVYGYMVSYGDVQEKSHCDVEPILLSN